MFENNRKLLDEFRKGQQNALSEVYYRCVDSVALVIRSGFQVSAKTGTRVPGISSMDLQRDLVQEVFVRAFSEKARLNYDGLRPYQPYLVQIGRNLLVDYWRKQGREISWENNSNNDSTRENSVESRYVTNLESVPPEDDLHWKTLKGATAKYVAALEPELREFVSLRFEEELSQYDLMKKLRISRWKVRRLEAKVQSGLMKFLKTQGLVVKTTGASR